MKRFYIFFVQFFLLSSGFAQNWEVVGGTQVTTNEVDQFSLAISDDSIVYVAFADLKANRRAQTKVFTNGAWESLGPSSGFSGSTSDLFDLQILPDGSPVLAFRDYNFKFGTRVLSYDINNTTLGWRAYGAQNNGLTDNYTTGIKLALNPDGIPFVGLNNRQFDSDFQILKFDSIDRPYQLLNNPTPGGQALGLYDMKFSPDGELYIVYQDPDLDTNSNINLNSRITVKKRVNNAWQLVGDPGISNGKTTDISIEFATDGTPYVAFVHQYQINGRFGVGGAVRKFDGQAWVPVGPENITPSYATYLDFKLSPSDTPVVSYLANGKLEAFAYNGAEWQKVGLNSASEGSAVWSKIEFGELGTLYAIFKDRVNDDKVTVTRYRGPLTSPTQTNGVMSNAKALTLNVFPNPCKENISIYNLPKGEKKVQLIDYRGRVIYQKITTDNSHNIDTQNLIEGVYFVQVLSGEYLAMSKVVVMPH